MLVWLAHLSQRPAADPSSVSHDLISLACPQSHCELYSVKPEHEAKHKADLSAVQRTTANARIQQTSHNHAEYCTDEGTEATRPKPATPFARTLLVSVTHQRRARSGFG